MKQLFDPTTREGCTIFEFLCHSCWSFLFLLFLCFGFGGLLVCCCLFILYFGRLFIIWLGFCVVLGSVFLGAGEFCLVYFGFVGFFFPTDYSCYSLHENSVSWNVQIHLKILPANICLINVYNFFRVYFKYIKIFQLNNFMGYFGYIHKGDGISKLFWELQIPALTKLTRYQSFSS